VVVLLAEGASEPDRGPLNAATKVRATHRPESLEWGPFKGVGPDLVEGFGRIKRRGRPGPGPLGISTLTTTVLEQGLADEVVLIVYPVLLGTGKLFLAEGTPARAFELVSTQATPTGVMLNTYKVAGPLKAG
jgi:hypothetical protein